MSSGSRKTTVTSPRRGWKSVIRKIWNYEPDTARAKTGWTWGMVLLGAFAPTLVYWILSSRIGTVMLSESEHAVDEAWALILVIPACALVFTTLLELLDFLGVGNGWWPPLAAKSLAMGATLFVAVISVLTLL